MTDKKENKSIPVIEAAKTFMGHRINQVIERNSAQQLAERGRLSGKDYWDHLKKSWSYMTSEEKEKELNIIN
jgi:hypothetical protein